MTTYYSIFDVNKPIMEANKEIASDSPTKAIKAYLKLIERILNQSKLMGATLRELRLNLSTLKTG